MVEPARDTIIDHDRGAGRHDTIEVDHATLTDTGIVTLVVCNGNEWGAIDLTAAGMIRLRDALTELIYEAGVEE